METRVALIDPLAIIDGRKAIFLRDNFGGEVPLSCAYPPLELAWTAAVLREAGIPVDLVAANVLDLPHAAVIERLRAAPPTHVLIPSAWGSLPDDFLLYAQLRRAFPDAVLMMSGPNVTARPDRPLLESATDVVILGEPEEATLLIAQGTSLEDVPNIAYVRGGAVTRTARRFPPGWPTYPFPARDLLPLDRYTIPHSKRLPTTTMATSRGCLHKCTFCPTQIWHQRQVRHRDFDLVMAEVDELVGRYGIREVTIRDDTFTDDRERVVAFCDALMRRGHDLTWRCFGTADSVDRDLLQLMAAAGCTQVAYGFESGDDAILSRTGKGTTVAQGVDAIRWSKAAGVEVSGTFLIGLEGETYETIARSIAFAKQNALDYIQVNVAVPMPSTGFGKRAAKKGFNARPELFRWFGAATSQTDNLGPEDLPRQARRFYREFYLRPAYIASRLQSQRGLRSLWSHVKLGARMAAHVATR